MKVLKVRKSDFFILDDGTNVKTLEPLKVFLHQYFENICVLSLREISQNLYQDFKQLIDFDDIFFVGLGQGGTIVLNYMIEASENQISSQNIQWSRHWIDRDNFDFIKGKLDKSIYSGKRIIFVEDVVASGKTIREAAKTFEKTGANIIGIISALINENSPALEPGFFGFALYGVHARPLSYKSDCMDSYWFPPIYSLRHLLYGEQENPLFYQILSEKYSLPQNLLQKTIDKIKPDIIYK